ncbi:MAG: hypothetical protein GY861_25040 [bacterium]|nr:hypothetical protein [bacterium]
MLENFKSWLSAPPIDSSCPMNIDKFGRARHHDFKLTYITKHMSSSTDYVVHKRCTYCSECTKDHFISHSECIRLGADSDELHNIKRSGVLGIHFKEESEEFIKQLD